MGALISRLFMVAVVVFLLAVLIAAVLPNPRAPVKGSPAADRRGYRRLVRRRRVDDADRAALWLRRSPVVGDDQWRAVIGGSLLVAEESLRALLRSVARARNAGLRTPAMSAAADQGWEALGALYQVTAAVEKAAALSEGTIDERLHARLEDEAARLERLHDAATRMTSGVVQMRQVAAEEALGSGAHQDDIDRMSLHLAAFGAAVREVLELRV